MHKPILAFAIAVAATSCATTNTVKPFEPTERVHGRNIQGYREAFYDLDAAGTKFGEAKVWSTGAFGISTPGGQRTIVRVGFTLDNTTKEPMQLNLGALRVESYQAKSPERADIPATLVSGDPIVPAGSSGTALVRFVLPRGVTVHAVNAFRIKWSVKAQGRDFTEYTPFVQRPQQYAYVPVSGYYNPYYPWDYPYYSPFWDWGYYPSSVVIVNPYPRRVVIHGHRHRR